jgi:hypothetical protein
MWKGLSPAFRTKAFETEADTLRGKALLKGVPDSSEVNWKGFADMENFRAFNDTIYYVLPKLLLVTTLFNKVGFGKLEEEKGKFDKEKDSSEIPLGVAAGTGKVQMINPEKASERVKDLFSSIKEKHGHPLVSSYYRGIANWPDLLEESWSRIKPMIGSSAYENRKQELLRQALKGIQGLQIPKIEKPEIDEEKSEEIRLILIAFQHKFIPEMLLDVAMIKAMIDGEKAAASSTEVA